MASSLFIFPKEKKSIISEQPKQKVNGGEFIGRWNNSFANNLS